MIRSFVLLMGFAGVVGAQDLFRTDPPSLGGVVFPVFHATAAYGDSTRDPADLTAHGHDPNDQFTLQGIDLGFSLQAGEHVSGFVNHRFFLDDEDDWDGEWEEAFLKLVGLPGDLELRGGRMLNRVGRQNSVHLHGWNFVDANLMTSRMLGEEGLLTNSVEVAWNVPTPFDSVVSVAFGEAVPHDEHDHGHEEEHEGEEDEDDHEEELEGEEGLFDRDILSVRYDARWNYNDFHQYRFGVNGVVGDNSFGRTTTAFGADVEYAWLENGLEGGGRSLRWRTEVMQREIEYQHEDGDGRGDVTELALSTMLLFGFAEDWEAGLRYGWVEGVSENHLHELPERYRLSAAVTRRLTFSDSTSGYARLQVNHEDHEEFGDETSVWLQFGFDFGAPEVR